MADEPRRSGRANRGQNKDRDITYEKSTDKKGRGKGSKTASAEPEAEEDDAIIRCICGATEDDEGLMMIVCENCDAWQHNLCMDVTEDENELENVTYYCEQCRPEEHRELLAAIKRGEKPWAEKKAQREAEKKRKKGKKGKGGRPSARASDIGTEEASPAPSSTKAEPTGKRKHGENGVNDASTPSREVDNLQKRRKSSHYADQSAPGSERRESSGAGRRSSAAGPVADSLDELQGQRKKVAEALAKELRRLIDEVSRSNAYRIPDGHTANSLGLQIALTAENGITAHNEDTKAYTDQFRTVHFNVKNNKSLLHRLLSGSLDPHELGRMSSDDLASEELQQEMAKMKEQADKQAIMIQEEAPRVRKTHKGDEVIENEGVPKHEDGVVSAALRRRFTEDVDMPDADNDDNEDRVELPEDIGRRPPLNVHIAGSPTQTHTRKGSSANFNINQVWDSVHSPDEQGGRPLAQPPRRQSSIKNDPRQQSAIADADVDRLLNDDPDDLTAEPVAEVDNTNALWNGLIDMAGVGRIRANAEWAAGGDPSTKYPWTKLLPPTLEVNGRIPISSADEYIFGMRNARSPTDVTVLAVKPTNSNHASFDTMFDYFHSRNRWGVFSTSHLTELKDMYLIPIDHGNASFPQFLSALEDNLVPTVRNSRLFLICMIVRSTSPPASASATPQVNDTAPIQSPALPQGPGQAPPQSYAPQGQPGPIDMGMIKPLAREILGDYVSSPTVLLMLGAVPDMEQTQLVNLKYILDNVPETRSDINALSQHLRESVEGGGRAGPGPQ